MFAEGCEGECGVKNMECFAAGRNEGYTLGQAADKAVGVGSLGGGDHLIHGCVRLAVGNVLPHRTGTQPGVLQHHAVAAAQGGAGHIPDIGAGLNRRRNSRNARLLSSR